MPNLIREWRKRRRCPHVHMNGIYGDAINLLNARLMCMDCGALLEGPVVPTGGGRTAFRHPKGHPMSDNTKSHKHDIPAMSGKGDNTKSADPRCNMSVTCGVPGHVQVREFATGVRFTHKVPRPEFGFTEGNDNE